jgi:AsmA protein
VRYLKWTAFGLAGLIVLGFLSLAVIVWVVDPNAFKPRIESSVKSATGREFTLVGDIDLDFFPWLALSTGEGSFGNPPGFPAEPMATWKQARLGVRLIPLLAGSLAVDRVKLVGADVRLTRRADGRANWEGIGGDEPADPNAPERHITIDGLELDESRLLFVDEAAGSRIEIDALRASTGAIEPDQPFTDTELDGVLHMQGFAPEGVQFHLRSPEIALTRDYSRLDIEEFEFSFGAMEATGKIAGELAEPMKLAGDISTNRFDPRALLGSVGIEAPKTTDPKALGQVQLAATWTFDAGAIGIEPAAFTLDDTRFTGKFHRAAGEDPLGEFEFRGDTLNISRYIPPTDPGSEPFVLPTADLRAMKFRGVIELEQAIYDDIEMKGVTLRLLLDEQGLRSQPEAVASQ